MTHRLAGIEQMDEIIFLGKGGIAMHGNHKELLATISGNLYFNLYRSRNLTE